MYDSEKRLVQLLLAETQKVVKKIQIEFNEEFHEKYPESFREEKLLIEKRNGKVKKRLNKMTTHLVSPKRKEGNVPSKDIVFFNEDQSEEIIPSKEELKLVTANRQQRKRNKTYADVIVNIKDDLEVWYKKKAIMARVLTETKQI